MPTYEYECTKCDHRFEVFQSMKDAPLQRCPKCRCKIRRVLGSGAGIIFKGSGFYQTDYRSTAYQEAAKKDTSPPASASKDSGTSKEKPAKSETTKKA